MIYLRINKGKAYFLNNEDSEIEIDKIGKDDILYLLDLATDVEILFEMDNFQDNPILNEAQKIIYESLYGKFTELLEDRTRFFDESSKIYAEAKRKYEVE